MEGYYESINKDDIVQRKEQIMKDFETLTKEVEATENKIKQMRNNLNAFNEYAFNNVICF